MRGKVAERECTFAAARVRHRSGRGRARTCGVRLDEVYAALVCELHQDVVPDCGPRRDEAGCVSEPIAEAVADGLHERACALAPALEVVALLLRQTESDPPRWPKRRVSRAR